MVGASGRGLGHVVVTVPYFRCRPYIRQCVESILGQTHRDLTVVVCNDGDPQAPWDLLEDLDDPRIVRFDLLRNRGRYFADQVVLATVDAPFLLVQDADDWSEPTRVERLLRGLRRDHGAAAVSEADRPGRGDGRPLVVGCARIAQPLSERLEHRAPYQGLYRTDVLRALGGFYAGFRVGYDTFLLSVVAMTGRVTTIREPLYHWRWRSDSLTQAPTTGGHSDTRQQAREALRAMYREAFAAYSDYLDGRLRAAALRDRIRELVTARIDTEARLSLTEASRRLALAIGGPGHPRARSARVAYRPAPPAAVVVEDPMPDGEILWGRSTISRRLVVALAERLERSRPRRVLEAGSGLSTLVLARYAARTGARIVTLEHDRDRAAQSLRRLADAGLSGAVDLRVVPLGPYACPDGGRRPWYDCRPAGPFDFVLLGGASKRDGRAAALFAVAPLLAEDWELWLPWAGRRDERCLELWSRHLRFTRRDWSVGGTQVAELHPAPGGAPIAATVPPARVQRAAPLLFWSSLDLHPWTRQRRSPAWIDYRFRHWLAYTLPSILAQHEADFRYWLICDPGGRALTVQLRASIRDDRVQLVYADECAGLLRQLPRGKRHLVARIDSDDLYHPAVAGDLLRRPQATRFLQFNDGYACDVRSGDVRRWTAWSSPFYCQIYGDELQRRDRWSEPNHATVRPRATVLAPGRVLVTLHDANTSSSIRTGTAAIGPASARAVLESFGLGRPRSLDAALSCARIPADWDARGASIRDRLRDRHASEPAAAETMSLEAATFFAFLCEATAARRILVAGSPFGAAVAREYGAVDTVAAADGGYDMLLLDLGGDPRALALLEPALRSLLPTGLALIDNCHGPGVGAAVDAVLRGWCADAYPEVPELTRDAGGRHAMLLGRVIGPLGGP